ncbi:CoA transferase [uncultured Azohydromonas sp.]|jgi:Predicted acyl-CoA transferases/carnitine dehydratase|uniref:CoA transferase n=1 Tax=uncultured Azohydromonas sp. TaxID=487342 RepID=UPI0026363408|nr:CoA transferase [uncultured Azohydromonas sp.]
MGADVLRVQRAGGQTANSNPVVVRGMRSIELDLKSDAGHEAVLRLVEKSDAVIEAFRPGVMERLGTGPEPCLACNPRLVYGRMPGWKRHQLHRSDSSSRWPVKSFRHARAGGHPRGPGCRSEFVDTRLRGCDGIL